MGGSRQSPNRPWPRIGVADPWGRIDPRRHDQGLPVHNFAPQSKITSAQLPPTVGATTCDNKPADCACGFFFPSCGVHTGGGQPCTHAAPHANPLGVSPVAAPQARRPPVHRPVAPVELALGGLWAFVVLSWPAGPLTRISSQRPLGGTVFRGTHVLPH